MTTASFSNLSWAQRLAVVSATSISDTQAATAFGVTVDELNTARESITPDTSFDVTPYKSHFAKTPSTVKAARKATSASNEPIVRKKRGKPGDKIAVAVNNITSDPQPFAEFCKKHKLSENTLKQLNSGRYDPAHKGQFAVRKHDGQTCIWRITTTTATE